MVAEVRMATQCMIFTVALICPLGALAVEPAIGSETDSRETAGVAGWARLEHEVKAGWTASGELRQTARIATRERGVDSANTADQVHRYGQRAPALEELPVTGRAAAVVDVTRTGTEP